MDPFRLRAPLGAQNVGRPSDGAHDTGKFRKHGIAYDLSNASTVPGNVRFHDFGSQRAPTAHGFDVIKSHQTGKACDVGKGNRSEPPAYGGWGDGRRLYGQHLVH